MARVTVNRAALREHFRSDPKATAALDLVVTAFKQEAEAESPVRTGYYQDRFRIRRYPGRRRLMNTDPFAFLTEFGSINNPAYAPMRRAARKLGFKVVETSK